MNERNAIMVEATPDVSHVKQHTFILKYTDFDGDRSLFKKDFYVLLIVIRRKEHISLHTIKTILNKYDISLTHCCG